MFKLHHNGILESHSYRKRKLNQQWQPAEETKKKQQQTDLKKQKKKQEKENNKQK